MKRILLEFLRDTLAAIAEIESFVEDVDSDGFAASREKVLAVVKLLEMIGEAVKQILNDKRELYPDIPWKLPSWRFLDKPEEENLVLELLNSFREPDHRYRFRFLDRIQSCKL